MALSASLRGAGAQDRARATRSTPRRRRNGQRLGGRRRRRDSSGSSAARSRTRAPPARDRARDADPADRISRRAFATSPRASANAAPIPRESSMPPAICSPPARHASTAWTWREPLIAGHPDAESLANLGQALDSSALFVQGPPGSGKTWTAARVILSPDRGGPTGRRDGDRPQGDREAPRRHRGRDRGDPGRLPRSEEVLRRQPRLHYESDHIESSTKNARLPRRSGGAPAPRRHRLALGARGDARGGRRPLRRRGRPGRARRRPRGLPRARRASSSSATLSSSLTSRRAPIPAAQAARFSSTCSATRTRCRPDRGVFLDLTYRMHPDVCRFVSEAMYEGRLHSAPGRERQAIESPGLIRDRAADALRRALRQPPARARGGRADREPRSSASSTAARSPTPTGSLATSPSTTSSSSPPTTPRSAAFADHLPEGARVGTVDKFQGQQAPVVFFSMTSS